MGGLGGETYHDKFLHYAEIGLEKDLIVLDSLSEIKGARELDKVQEAFSKNKRFKKERTYSPEKTIFNPLKVKAFFNQLEHAGGNIFAIPVVVEKKSINVCENYRLLFSTVYDEKNKGFPVFYCTREEFEEKKVAIGLSNALPMRSKEENERFRQSTGRYSSQNEDTIDKNIRTRITEEGNFTEFKERVKDLGLNEKYKERDIPESNLPEEYFDYIKTEIDGFLKFLGADITVDTAFEDKNVVFLKVPDWAEFPEIEEDGKKLRVTSHTSENAVYKFLSQKKFDTLIDENGLMDKAEKVLDETIIDFVHEIGVIYNMRWGVAERDQVAA